LENSRFLNVFGYEYMSSLPTLRWVTQQPTFNTISDDTDSSIAIDGQTNIYVSYTTINDRSTSTGRDIVVFKLSQRQPSLELVLYTVEKTPKSCQMTMVDDLLTFSYSIKNTSDVALTNLVVHDTLVNHIILQQTTLQPNQRTLSDYPKRFGWWCCFK